MTFIFGNTGVIFTKTPLTTLEKVEVSKMISKGICNHCIAYFLMQRKLVVNSSLIEIEMF